MSDLPDVCTISTPKARKPHKCCECKKEINIVDFYENVKGKWNGSFDEFKTCMRCVAIRSDYISSECGYDVDEYPPFGQLFEYIRQTDYRIKK